MRRLTLFTGTGLRYYQSATAIRHERSKKRRRRRNRKCALPHEAAASFSWLSPNVWFVAYTAMRVKTYRPERERKKRKRARNLGYIIYTHKSKAKFYFIRVFYVAPCGLFFLRYPLLAQFPQLDM